jgi:hypothetical protein
MNLEGGSGAGCAADSSSAIASMEDPLGDPRHPNGIEGRDALAGISDVVSMTLCSI